MSFAEFTEKIKKNALEPREVKCKRKRKGKENKEEKETTEDEIFILRRIPCGKTYKYDVEINGEKWTYSRELMRTLVM